MGLISIYQISIRFPPGRHFLFSKTSQMLSAETGGRGDGGAPEEPVHPQTPDGLLRETQNSQNSLLAPSQTSCDPPDLTTVPSPR